MDTTQTTLRQKMEYFAKQAEDAERNRLAIQTVLQLLEQDATAFRQRTKYQGPERWTNVGRAVGFLRDVYPAGLTMAQLIQKSAENGGKAFTASSIGSQLRFQEKKFGTINKVGDIYYAIM